MILNLSLIENLQSFAGITIKSVRETKNVTLKCPDEDEGPDDSKWSRQFGEIPQQRFQMKKKKLIIKHVKQKDTGLYYCGGKPAVFLNVTSRSATKEPLRTPTITSTSTTTSTTTPTTTSTTPRTTTPTTTSTTMPTTTSTTTPTTTSTTTPTTTTPTTTSTTPTTTTTTTTSTTMSTTTSTKTAISTTKTQNEVTLLPWLILVGALIFLIIITTACFTWRKKCKKQEAGAECHVYDEVSHTTGLQPDSDSPYSLIGPSRPSPISGTNQDLLYSVIGQTPCFENNQDSPYSLIGPSPCSGNDGGLSFPADSTYFLLEKPKAPTNHDEQL
ncbi:mucin-2-like isoform X2 [Oryzias latipes]|uniref:mucin-2-like isoform X2 n=1 Tax=Oryzias latipes TaxID=8090 RepID=UPI000CE1FCF7|nr:mucin-2-like isoform X2 [Oryzias latipes]